MITDAKVKVKLAIREGRGGVKIDSGAELPKENALALYRFWSGGCDPNELKAAQIIAAYLLDRADQYETESPCWIALGDAAANIMNGEATAAFAHGELDDLLERVERLRRSGAKPKSVDPKAGIE